MPRRGLGSWGKGEGGVGDTSIGGGVEAAEEEGRLAALRGRENDGVGGWLWGERTRKLVALSPNTGSATTKGACWTTSSLP